MQHNFDLLTLPVSRRLQMRMQLVRHREGRIQAWKACYRQVKRHATGSKLLSKEAINQAHEAHVVLDMVGQPLWTN